LPTLTETERSLLSTLVKVGPPEDIPPPLRGRLAFYYLIAPSWFRFGGLVCLLGLRTRIFAAEACWQNHRHAAATL
jgi:hypothetical protein